MKRGIYQGIIVCVSLLLVMVVAYTIPQLMSSNQQQIQMNPSLKAEDIRSHEANNVAIKTDNVRRSDEDTSEGGGNKVNQGEPLEDVELASNETLDTKDQGVGADSQEVSSDRGQMEPANSPMHQESTVTKELEDDDMGMISDDESSSESIENKESELPAGLSSDEEIGYVKDQWVNDMIQENRQDISDSDLSEGAPIYDKLDSGYLFSLAEDGLTEDEEKEAKAYMESRLSGSELSRAIELYNKYIGLVNND